MDSHSSIAAVFRSPRHEAFNRKLAEDEPPSNVTARAMGAYSSDRERAFHMIVNSHVMWAAGVDLLR